MVSNQAEVLLVSPAGWIQGQAVKTAYYDEPTRSIIDLLPPGELFPGWTISRVSVLPAHRGQKIARRLMAEVVADAEKEGALLFLDVRPSRDGLKDMSFDQLVEWYSRCGFMPSRLGFPSMIRVPTQMGTREPTLGEIVERLIHG